MSDREHEDLLIERAIAELRTLPAVKADVVARVAVAAMARAAERGDERVELAPEAPTSSRRARRIAVYVGLAAAACLVGYLARDVVQPARSKVDGRIASATAAPVVPVVDGRDADARPLPRQFVFQSRSAHRVALVGDFNGWNPRATPLERAPGSGLWAVTLPVLPGRHSYAFMVDDSVFALDPRAVTAKDPDLGTTASVIVVGRP